jgi:histidine triad (HIT) family protein
MILKGKEVAKEAGVAESGYKLLFNVERGGGQVIFHLHLHLLGGWR